MMRMSEKKKNEVFIQAQLVVYRQSEQSLSVGCLEMQKKTTKYDKRSNGDAEGRCVQMNIIILMRAGRLNYHLFCFLFEGVMKSIVTRRRRRRR